jgi:hypothetical protein
MDTTLRTARPHNALWRKFRRRTLFDTWGWTVGGGLALIPPACMVAWLWKDQGWGWLAQTLRGLWFLESLFIFLISGFVCLIWPFLIRNVDRSGLPTVLERRRLLATPIAAGGKALALLVGRVDWAVICSVGLDAVGLVSGKKAAYSWRMLPRVLLDIGVIAAFLAHSTGLLIAVWLAAWLVMPWLTPTLREVVARKPTRADYVGRLQQQCASGHG